MCLLQAQPPSGPSRERAAVPLHRRTDGLTVCVLDLSAPLLLLCSLYLCVRVRVPPPLPNFSPVLSTLGVEVEVCSTGEEK
ncbi:hypothetical protein NQZ68_013634 [Dissostichus eleginoides]|nr:hypothetical protein NQZ68_013634 [Dissostichus eleginoides]